MPEPGSVAWQSNPDLDESVKWWASHREVSYVPVEIKALDVLPRRTCPLHPEGCAHHIKSLAIAMRQGAHMPPVVLEMGPDKKTFRVLDGNHRIVAAKALRHTHVPAMVIHNHLWPVDRSKEMMKSERLGKSQRARDVAAQVASIAPVTLDGRLLFIQRADSGKYTLPGGHLNPNEDPARGAIRELMEETGMKPKLISHLSSQTVTGSDGRQIVVHAFMAIVEGEPTAAFDPDHEASSFRWVPAIGIPPDVLQNLAHDRDVTLYLMGLQRWGDASDHSVELKADLPAEEDGWPEEDVPLTQDDVMFDAMARPRNDQVRE